jgi:diguanylate cyclase (GGDEF)-like protein
MRFGQLSLAARAYVLGVCALAGAALLQQWHPLVEAAAARQAWAWAVFPLLTAAAAAAHMFPVSTPGRQAFHVSLPFFVVAVAVLPPPLVVALVVAVHAAEWWWLRARRTPFVQLFNTSVYLLTATAAQAALAWASGGARFDLRDPGQLVAGLAAVAVFALVNRALVSGVVWLAHGLPPQRQTMFRAESLLTDGILLAMGLPLSELVVATPWVALLAAAPLFLIHRALEVPNMREQRREDGLTQLSTASSFADAVRRELSRAERFGRSVALLVVDIDRLGDVNTDHGHQAGDSVIREVARLLKEGVRGYDVAARVVGGQFALLLPEIDRDGAGAFAERLRREIAARRFDVASSFEPLRITASAGVAVTEAGGRVTADQLMAAASAALAQAKRVGRDRSCLTAAAATPPSIGLGPAEEGAAATAVGRPAEPIRPPDGPARSVGGPPGRWGELWRRHAARLPLLVSLALAPFALAVVAAVAPGIVGLDPALTVLLIAFVAVAEALGIELFGRSSYSLSTVPILAAAMGMGVPGAIVVGASSQLFRGLRRRTRWNKVLFNVSTYVLTGAAVAALYGRMGAPLTAANLPTSLGPALLVGSGFSLHTLIVAVGMATELRVSPLRVWSENFRWLWLHYLVLGAMGLLLATAYAEFGMLGAAAFVVPPLMMRHVAKQYIDRALENVRQLRRMNEQLQIEIAQRKTAEAENARLAEEAARAAALEELNRLKSEFISIASHELRTPMTSIMGFSELLLEHETPSEMRERWLLFINKESRQLASLVDNLLDVSRIETGRIALQLGAVDLQAAVDDVLGPLAASAPHHTLTVDLAPDARWVQADPGKLGQILMNVIGNAIKYSLKGGRIDVTARRDPAGQIMVAVSDQGVGIPTEYRDRIFERFQRVDTSETRGIRGSGLGLYIVRHLVELHGGTIEVESEIGKGSTFRFTLPCPTSQGAAAPERDTGELAPIA